jgi:cyclopropane-fatty-acyl-phospholipid synthase
MLEHVGVRHYEEFGRLLHDVVAPHGRGLVHSIGRNDARPVDAWIRERIFPGCEVPSLAEMATIFAPWDLSVLDVENLRLHYAMTLRDWIAAYESSADRVRSMFDEEFVRAWRLYLAGSAAAFRSGELQLFQFVFAPRVNTALPLTRERLLRV